ncbi:MAG TPA: ERCC4 domain-containing protein [Planctomycetota bacterium]|nr:ERCC4 domain-containing protein [Planctomycetota bacterium]
MPVPKPILVVDSREPVATRWRFRRFTKWFAGIESGALKAGDYAIGGYEGQIAVERKTATDAVQSTAPSQARERFIASCQRLSKVYRAAVVVEAGYARLHRPVCPTDMHPNAVLGTLLALQCRFNLPFVFAGSRSMAEEWAAHFLSKSFVHLWLRDNGYGEHFVDGDV